MLFPLFRGIMVAAIERSCQQRKEAMLKRIEKWKGAAKNQVLEQWQRWQKMVHAIECKALQASAQLPTQGTQGAAGWDLYSASTHTIAPGERILIDTGLAVAVPRYHHLEIRPRSGLALKHGITVLNTPGTVDDDYRGALQVLLVNHGNEPFLVEEGSRIAQAVLMRHVPTRWVLKEALKPTARGEKGWGHTGK